MTNTIEYVRMEVEMDNLLLAGIGIRQRVAWIALDSCLCFIQYMKTQPAPMPWQEIGKN